MTAWNQGLDPRRRGKLEEEDFAKRLKDMGYEVPPRFREIEQRNGWWWCCLGSSFFKGFGRVFLIYSWFLFVSSVCFLDLSMFVFVLSSYTLPFYLFVWKDPSILRLLHGYRARLLYVQILLFRMTSRSFGSSCWRSRQKPQFWWFGSWTTATESRRNTGREDGDLFTPLRGPYLSSSMLG